MKRVAIFLLILEFSLANSCTSDKEQRISTAFKVVELLNEQKAEKLHDMILLDADKIGLDTFRIRHDCKAFRFFTDKYGFPDSSKWKYIENPNDWVEPYKVEFPIFDGNDTVGNWNLRKVSLEVNFGPKKFNRVSKIADYHLVLDFDVDWKSTKEPPQY
ncbi:MAG TPA: hypothetical protein VE978_20365 [Chitinophagales bacterium]|nr:hypothetical protein [Chitinophagales bacterium]